MPKETKKERRERWQSALELVVFPDDSTLTIKNALNNYSGDFTVLESAIGAFFLGFCLGWRPLVVIHSPKTIKRYEKILSVDFKSIMPEVTDLSDRSKGYEIAKQLDNFWLAVTGNVAVEERKIAIGLDVQSP